MAGHAVRAAYGLLAHHRLDAVAADHRVGLVDIAGGIHHIDAFVADMHVLHVGGSAELDQRVLLHCLEYGQMDVGAMYHRVGAAEAAAKCLAGLDAHDFLGVDGIHHDDVIGENRAAARHLAHAQGVQRREGVGAELDARADLADVRGLLQQLDFDALARQRQRGRQAAYAAAYDDGFLCGFFHDVFNTCIQSVRPPAAAGSWPRNTPLPRSTACSSAAGTERMPAPRLTLMAASTPAASPMTKQLPLTRAADCPSWLMDAQRPATNTLSTPDSRHGTIMRSGNWL